jgi:glycosyltransferase involved in cell wall biosynthesis
MTMRPARDPLRIAQVAPVAEAVRPGEGGSIEQLVSLLTEGLVSRGHEVTLYATGDSVTSAQLRAVEPRGYDIEDVLWDWYRSESFHAAAVSEHATDHDVIHAHNFHFTLPFSRFTGVPLVETAHTEVPPEVRMELGRRPDVQLIAVSDYASLPFAGRPNVSVIPHGIDVRAFPFGQRSEGYLLFLGRILADKGPAEAVEIARAAGLPIILAGPEQDGYDLRAAIDLDAPDLEWVGPVQPPQRNRLLAGAVALLFPASYPEPFGLVMVEAMACGTPVLATALGATREIIEEGVTGYTASSWQDLPALVPAAARLDRGRIRERARERFDTKVMIDLHEDLYRRIVNGRRG